MSTYPLVSVITPSYNQGRFIEQTIQSVLKQDYPHIEYLVVDGGSKDNTIDILRKYEDRLIWISEPDRGQTDAINKGFSIAKGEILCWLNSDDTYEPGAIQKAVEIFLDNPDVMMVYGEGNEIDENGNFIQRFPATQKFDLWKLIYVWDYILQPTTFFRKNIFDKIPLLDTNLRWCMDWDLWIRIGSKFRVAYIDHVLANSRIYSKTKTGSGGIKRFQEIVSVIRKYGKRRYPLGYFYYGVDTCQKIAKDKFPFIYFFLRIIFYISWVILIEKLKNYQGLYSDNWLGKKSRFMISLFKKAQFITFEMESPVNNDKIYPNKVSIKVNNSENKDYVIKKPGNFSIEVPINSQIKSPVEVEMVFDKTFTLKSLTSSIYSRKVSCLLHEIKFIS